MFLGFDDSLKALKKELKGLGADIGLLRDWQKSYDKVCKQAPLLEAKYNQVKSELELVYKLLQELEQLLAAGSSLSGAKASEYTRELKKYQDHFVLELLIGKEDREFHLTYATILKLCAKVKENRQELLILQSEVENLLAITKEALEKKAPDFYGLAFFYLSNDDKQLAELPHTDKLVLVSNIYEREFLNPIRQLLSSCMDDDRVRQIMEVELWIC